jgi:hypothetical protein
VNTRILLTCAVAVAIASTAFADQIQRYDPPPDASITTRIPGSLDPAEKHDVGFSFEPMRAPRDPCHTMVLTSMVDRPAENTSFARLPNDRHPVVACAPAAMVQTAALEPPPVYRTPEPEPVVAPYVEPARVVTPTPEELPHTASLLPLVGLIGLLSLGASALLRVGRSVAS